MADAAGKLQFVRDEIVLPSGATVGQALASGRDPWVEEQLLGPAFATGGDGLPRFALVYEELPRGCWKSGGAGGIALAEAVLEPGTDVVNAAGDTDQAAIVLGHVDGYLERNPRLDALVARRSNERLVEGGSRIRVISSDAPTAWGLGGTHRRFRVLADELTVWKDAGEDLWSALASATGKVPDAQTIVLSNAGFDSGRAWQWRVREAARTADWGHLYAPRGIPASWVAPTWVEQQRALLPPVAFRRVIENEWTAGAGDFVSPEQWARCVDPTLAPRAGGRGRFVGALDLGLVKDRTAFAVAHRDGDNVVLDDLQVWQGTRGEPVSIATVEQALLDAAGRFGSLRVAVDPWQLKGSVERLRAAGLAITEFAFSQTSVQRLSGALFESITAATLRVYPDADLEAEILGLRTVQTANGWRFDHGSRGFSDRAVALAMAVQLARKQPRARAGRTVSVPKGRIPEAPRGRHPLRARGLLVRDVLAERLGAAGLRVDGYDTSGLAARLGRRS
jgi:hypothetical protein